MTAWDLRTFARALGATLIGIVVVWLVTAASDEGQLTVGVRAGRTLPLAPLCSAIGAALALGTARVRDETRALEALGRSPGQSARAAALGAALPSILIGLAIGLELGHRRLGLLSARASRRHVRLRGRRVHQPHARRARRRTTASRTPSKARGPTADEGLPRHARAAAVDRDRAWPASRSRSSPRAPSCASACSIAADGGAAARIAAVQVFACVLLTLVAFQAAAARVAPASLAMLPAGAAARRRASRLSCASWSRGLSASKRDGSRVTGELGLGPRDAGRSSFTAAPATSPPSRSSAHVAGCERAAAEGAKVLAAGGSALDAVQRAVEVLESDPLFNAGTGACLDADGHLALDASIMDGNDLRAGARLRAAARSSIRSRSRDA